MDSQYQQGQGAQVVLAGNISYRFNEAFSLGVGIGGLPSTRTTNYTFPQWLRVDNRTIADEFFRGSYTTGIWAWGKLSDTLRYRVMLGNNLSQLGVDAGELDATLNTVSGALWWMPTTGEYGPGEGFGDFEHHNEAATLFGVNFTRSREDAAESAGTEQFREQPDPSVRRHHHLPDRPVRHRHAGAEGHLPDGGRQRGRQVPGLVAGRRVLLALGGRFPRDGSDAFRRDVRPWLPAAGFCDGRAGVAAGLCLGFEDLR